MPPTTVDFRYQHNTTWRWYRSNIGDLHVIPLQWRHNERDGVSNHRRLHNLLNSLFRRRSKKTSMLRITGLSKRNQPVTGGFHSQRSRNRENVSIWRRYHVNPWRHAQSYSRGLAMAYSFVNTFGKNDPDTLILHHGWLTQWNLVTPIVMHQLTGSSLALEMAWHRSVGPRESNSAKFRYKCKLILYKENAFDRVVCKTSAILFRPLCV